MTMTDFLLQPSREDMDPELCEAVRALGRRFGPMGVAVAAASYTDPNYLVAALQTRTQQVRDATTDAMPDAHRSGPVDRAAQQPREPYVLLRGPEDDERVVAVGPTREDVMRPVRADVEHGADVEPFRVVVDLAALSDDVPALTDAWHMDPEFRALVHHLDHWRTAHR